MTTFHSKKVTLTEKEKKIKTKPDVAPLPPVQPREKKKKRKEGLSTYFSHKKGFTRLLRTYLPGGRGTERKGKEKERTRRMIGGS